MPRYSNIVKIEQRIKEIFAQEMDCGIEELKPETLFGGDSLDHVQLIMVVEEAFDIQISDDMAETLKSIEQFVSYVSKATDLPPHWKKAD
jgi:acyl carrier protein